jgi:hypothetical protein
MPQFRKPRSPSMPIPLADGAHETLLRRLCLNPVSLEARLRKIICDFLCMTFQSLPKQPRENRAQAKHRINETRRRHGELTRLVAVLESRDYEARIGKETRDGGVDIVAIRDAMLGSEKLVVQIKTGESG